jgi:UDP-N-acetylglucosamine--N-acetylmuramyl-(pentapeptide) pyrophosphoryl-undecaprenol N-acetylglucosamine transferase
VAEDHQTKNALALVNRDAALYVKDADAVARLLPLALETIGDEVLLSNLRKNILTLAFHNSAEVIADEVIALATKYRDEKK